MSFAGVAALAQPAIPAVEGYWDAQQGIQVHGRPGFPATPSGVDMIIQTLEAQYGELQTDLKGKALDRFFGLHRMNGSLHDYCTAFRIRYETAQEQAGLQINDVAKTHLFLKNAGITQKYYDELMMKVNFDRTNFVAIHNLVSQMGRHHQTYPEENHGHLLYMSPDTDEEDDWYDEDPIEYFTDCAGQWYIWDYNLCAGYYLDMSEEEYNFFVQDTWIYWDQCQDEKDYEAWDSFPESSDWNNDNWDDPSSDSSWENLSSPDSPSQVKPASYPGVDQSLLLTLHLLSPPVSSSLLILSPI